jgi:hypothetical protein
LIVETAERMLGAPLDVHAAIGHGRSYGQKSFLIARSIQGTLNCGLWERIGWRDKESDSDEPADQSAQAEEPPLYALLTDVGNDIMYCVEPDQIIEWVGECISRLKQLKARIVMTGLPMAVVDRIGQYQYLLFRTLFFPKNTLSLEETAERARHVQQGLQKLAADHDVPFVEQKHEWYGIDPIHIRRAAIVAGMEFEIDICNRKRATVSPASAANTTNPHMIGGFCPQILRHLPRNIAFPLASHGNTCIPELAVPV